jgi:crotonobetainyl-CoA:carnitine CoA-transferase CaiB-like acyl-CoA transferase
VIGLDELVHDEHLKQTDFFYELNDESMGHMRFPGVPVRFDGERPGIGMPPRLGEHTIEILTEAGLSLAEIEQLLSTGAAFQQTFDQVDRPNTRYEEFGGAHV